jgi:peptide/nickel transport system substrate-binding protein
MRSDAKPTQRTIRRRQLLRNATVWPLTAGLGGVARAAPGDTPIKIASFQRMRDFDPLGPYPADFDTYLFRAVFPPLVRIVKASNDPLAGWEPFAATPSVVQNSQNRTYIDIAVAPGRQWSDGSNYSAAEIKRGMERAKRALVGTNASLVADIDSIEILDDIHCRVKLKRPTERLYKELFSRTWASPLTDIAEQSLQAHSYPSKGPPALGPYHLVAPFTPGAIAVMQANTQWTPQPAIKTFIIKHMDDVDIAIAAFKAGDVDLVPLPSGRVLARKADIAAQFGDLAQVTLTSIDDVTYVAMDTTGGATSDQTVRQAARAAINTADVARDAFGADGIAPTSDLLPRAFAVGNHESNRFYDPARAKALLASAGYSTGFEAPLLVPADAPEAMQRLAETVRDRIREVGIQLIVTHVPFPEIFSPTRPRGAFVLWRTPIVLTAVAGLTSFTTGASANLPRFSNAQFDRAVQALDTATQATELNGRIAEAQELLDHAAVGIPIGQESRAFVHRASLVPRFAPDGTLGDLVDFTRA